MRPQAFNPYRGFTRFAVESNKRKLHNVRVNVLDTQPGKGGIAYIGGSVFIEQMQFSRISFLDNLIGLVNVVSALHQIPVIYKLKLELYWN